MLLMLLASFAPQVSAQDFEDTYEGKTITYTILDEAAKTVSTKAGEEISYWQTSPGNKVTGDLILPAHPKNGDVEYTLVSIGENGFYNQDELTSIVIPSTVTSIGADAFYSCTGLTSIEIPESVTSIGSGAFSDCSELTKAVFASIASLCAIQFGNYDANPLRYAPLVIDGLDIDELIIPETVTSIGSYALAGCTGLTSVDIPASVTSIGAGAFYMCTGLTSVDIPASVTSIGARAFYMCTGLTKSEFASIESLCAIQFGDEDANPLDYTHKLFIKDNEQEITELVIPETVTSIGSYAFAGCTGLTSIEIPANVTSIGEGAFSGCKFNAAKFASMQSLCSIHYGSQTSNPLNLAQTLYINGIEVTKESLSNLKITEVTTIASYAFAGCSSINSVEISGSVETIGSYAFSDCENLNSVTIGENVTKIGDGVFNGCTALSEVTLGENVAEIGAEAFYGCYDLTAIKIPASVKNIGEYAFSGCMGLKQAEFASIESLCTIQFANDNSNPIVYAGNLYIDGALVDDITIPETVTSICPYAFTGSTNLTSVEIPGSVESIGRDAFSNCSELTSVTIGENVTEIGGSAFSSCKKLASITIPNSVNKISDHLFSNCSGLTSVIIEENVTEIGVSAFNGCTGLTSIVIPNSVTKIDAFAFSSCTGLSSVTLGKNVTEIESSFYNCTNLASIEIPNSVIKIGESAFSSCSALTSIVIPNSVTSIGEEAFDSCSALTSVTIGENVTEIGMYAFWDTEALKTVTVLAKVPPTIYDDTFNFDSASEPEIIVPGSALETYKSAPIWENYNLTGFADEVTEGVTPSVYPRMVHLDENGNGIIEFRVNTDVENLNSFQVDLYMPEGFQIAKDESEKYDIVVHAEGFTFEVTENTEETPYYHCVFTSESSHIAAGDNNLLSISIVAPASFLSNTTYSNCEFRNMQFKTADGLVTYKPEDYLFYVAPQNIATGIEDVMQEQDTPKAIYNLQGILLKRDATADDVNALRPGLYIIGGKKVMVK